MYKFVRIILSLCSIIWIGSCGVDDTPEFNQGNKPADLKYLKVFKENSIFYQKIKDGAEVDPNSSVMVESLIDQEADQGFLIVVKEWTVPVYYASDSTPRTTVLFTRGWAPRSAMNNVPIPTFAEPDPSADAHMVVVDEEMGCIYDFWEASRSGNSWSAGWGNALALNGDGIFPKGFSARGSGFELLQGLIWPHELEAGEINHALIFSYDHTRSGGPVPPATESDGTTNKDWGIPEGALVQLNPDLDLTGLGLNSYETTVAVALQKYGMYCADDGGGISLYAVNPISCQNNPYEKIWGNETYIGLSKIPVSEFRILKLPDQTNFQTEIVNNSCSDFQ